MTCSTVDLTGKIAIVTGAVRGIGAQTAALLEERGASVYAADRDPGDRRGTVIPLMLDITDKSGVESALESVMANHGRIDILENCAGVFGFDPRRQSDLGAMNDEIE